MKEKIQLVPPLVALLLALVIRAASVQATVKFPNIPAGQHTVLPMLDFESLPREIQLMCLALAYVTSVFVCVCSLSLVCVCALFLPFLRLPSASRV